MKVRELFVQLGFTVDSAAADKAKQTIGDVAKTVAKIGVAYAAANTAALVWVKGIAESVVEIKKMAAATSLSSEMFQKLSGSAQRFGLNADATMSLLKDIAVRSVEAANGSADMQQAWGLLGISLKRADGVMKSNLDLLYEIADAAKNMQDGVQKTEVFDRMFGDVGPQALGWLSQGSLGIQNMSDKIKAAGGVMSDNVLNQAVELNSQYLQFKTTLTVIGASLLPFANKLTGAIRSVVSQHQKEIVSGLQMFSTTSLKVFSVITRVLNEFGATWLKTKNIKPIVEGITKALDLLGDGLVWVVQKSWEFKEAIVGLGIAFAMFKIGSFIMNVKSLVLGFLGLTGAANASALAILRAAIVPILITAGVAALVLAIDDLWTYLQGGESVIGDLIGSKDKILKAVDGVFNSILAWFGFSNEQIKEIKSSFGQFFTDIGNLISWLTPYIATVFTMYMQGARNVFNYIIDGITWIIKIIGEIASGELWNKIANAANSMLIEMQNSLANLWDYLMSGVEYVWASISNVFSAGIKWISDLIKIGIDLFFNKIEDAHKFIDNIFETISEKIEEIRNIMQLVFSWVWVQIGKVADAFKITVSDVFKNIAGIFGIEVGSESSNENTNGADSIFQNNSLPKELSAPKINPMLNNLGNITNGIMGFQNTVASAPSLVQMQANNKDYAKAISNNNQYTVSINVPWAGGNEDRNQLALNIKDHVRNIFQEIAQNTASDNEIRSNY